MKVLKFILQNLDHFKSRFFLVFLAGILSGLATFFIPVSLAEFTKGELSFLNFQKLVLYILVSYIVSLTLERVIRKHGESLGPQYSNHIRIKYFKALESLPYKDLVRHHTGYVLSLINTVSDGLAPVIFAIFWTYARSISTLSLFFYFTAKESTAVAFLNLVVLSIFVAISTFLSRKMVPIADVLNAKRAQLMEQYTDFIGNILTVKRLGIYSFVEGKVARRTKDNYKQIQKLLDFHANRWFLLHSLFGIAFLSTIGFLLFQISKGGISVSVLILFVAAYGTVRGNVEQLSENFKELMELRAYLDSLNKIVSSKAFPKKGRRKESWEKIGFKEVEFKHAGTAKKIRIPKFTIKKGEKICIIGKSGEGKTTFLNLFANFLTPQKGARLVDGVPYAKINKDFFQEKIALIPQDVELFNLSIRENMALGKRIGDKKLISILEKVDLYKWFLGLRGGLNAKVGEKGVKLSSGQKQRINIVRGVLLDKKILVLDEPMSHLDPATETKVIDFLKKHLSGKTSIIVSHHKALRDICDRTYAIREHTLVES